MYMYMYRDGNIVTFSQISKFVFAKMCPPLTTLHKVPFLAPCPFHFLAGTLHYYRIKYTLYLTVYCEVEEDLSHDESLYRRLGRQVEDDELSNGIYRFLCFGWKTGNWSCDVATQQS